MSGYTILGIILVVVTLWMAYEIWRAPLMEETEDGGLRTIRPTRIVTPSMSFIVANSTLFMPRRAAILVKIVFSFMIFL